MPALGPTRRPVDQPSRSGLDEPGAATARQFPLRSVARLPFWGANVDTNAYRVTTFLAAHPGQFYCDACLSIEAVPGLNRIQINNLTRPLRHVTPYRKGTVVCARCGEVHECVAYGVLDLGRHGHTRVDHLSLAQARQLGATARRTGRPIYENPCRGRYFDAWREGWQGASSALGGSRSPLRLGSFGAELYDYLVRHDQDEGLTMREITDGLVERDSATVSSGLSRLCKKGLVRRRLPKVVGWHRTPQRYRAVPPGEAK